MSKENRVYLGGRLTTLSNMFLGCVNRAAPNGSQGPFNSFKGLSVVEFTNVSTFDAHGERPNTFYAKVDHFCLNKIARATSRSEFISARLFRFGKLVVGFVEGEWSRQIYYFLGEVKIR